MHGLGIVSAKPFLALPIAIAMAEIDIADQEKRFYFP